MEDSEKVSFGRGYSLQKNQESIKSFNTYIKNLCQQEANKTLSKKAFNQLTNEQENGIKTMLNSISHKLTADLADQLKSPFNSEKLHLIKKEDDLLALCKKASEKPNKTQERKLI